MRSRVQMRTDLDPVVAEAIRFLEQRGFLLDIDFTSNTALTLAGEVALMDGFGPLKRSRN